MKFLFLSLSCCCALSDSRGQESGWDGTSVSQAFVEAWKQKGQKPLMVRTDVWPLSPKYQRPGKGWGKDQTINSLKILARAHPRLDQKLAGQWQLEAATAGGASCSRVLLCS
jgi:hypothetical protein